MFGPFPSERVILSSHCARHCFPPLLMPTLLDFTLEILPSDQIRDIVVVILVLLASFLLLQALIALRQFPQRSQAVRAQLVEDARDELGEFFVFTVTVDGKGIGGDCGVNCDTGLEKFGMSKVGCKLGGRKAPLPLGAAKWITFPSSLNMFTSSIAWIGWTLSFLREVCSFLSSVPDVLWTFFCFLRGVPLPLWTEFSSSAHSRMSSLQEVHCLPPWPESEEASGGRERSRLPYG